MLSRFQIRCMAVSGISILFAVLLLLALVGAAHGQSIISATTQACPAGGVSGGQCWKLITDCPGDANFQVMAKVNTPSNPIRTVTLLEGGGGNGGFYDTHYAYGTFTVNSLLNANFRTVQLNFNGGPNGWLTGSPTFPGPRKLACRGAAVLQWLFVNIASSQAPFCGTGTSGGSGMLAYILAEYGGANLSFVQLVSGPVFSRLDEGCGVVNAPSIPTFCGAVLSPTYNSGQETLFINPTYGVSCTTKSATTLLDDSILAPDAFPNGTASFPNVTIHQLMGLKDQNPNNGAAPAQAALWVLSVPQTQPQCVSGAIHEMAATLVGANAIVSDMKASCQ